MGFRFRKSFKIAPGVKVNFNKKSTGVTFGGKGFHYTVNSKGKKTTSVGIPGTGLSYSTSSGGSSKKQTNKSQGSANVMNTANTQKWYQKTGYIILLLILFFPVGLFLMWKYTNWGKNVKIAISAIIAVLFGIGLISSGSDEPVETVVSDTGIESFDFYDTDALELEVGEKDKSYFEVEGNEEFSIDDIKLVSSDNNVVTFTYDKTLLTTHVYYVIEAVGPGTATVYVQTADGIIKSDAIQITVTGEEITSKAPETTTKDETTTQETTTNAPETTTAEKTTVAETTTEKQTATERETTTEKPAGRTVYRTKSGECYHYSSTCPGKNGYAVTLDEAIAAGKRPCEKCVY